MARRTVGFGSVSSVADHYEGKANPRSFAARRPKLTSDYARFADEIRGEFNPAGPLERLMTEHVIDSAWRLKRSIDRQVARHLIAISDSGEIEPAPKRESTAPTDRAARSLREAVEAFDYLHDRRPKVLALVPTVVARPEVAPVHREVESNEWPYVQELATEDASTDPDFEIVGRDRLVYDFEISDISPVVKGTWITVSHVVSLIVDGWTWADILRAHPELTEADVRTCLAYAVAEESVSV